MKRNKLSKYDRRFLNLIERRMVKRLKKMWWRSQAHDTPMAGFQYHNDAEAIRSRYGYSGGIDGNSFIPV